ncbi:MAG: DUF309 domain-containing protein [Chloroflexota bacterium]|nr:DUF309 domain-containing protein [Chloroflexota bacterium]
MNDRPVPASKRERPRDALGRPLPWGSPSQLALDDFDALPPERCHALALEAFDRGAYFPAHEAWEAAWRQRKGTPEEAFFKALAQLGAGYTHWRRGNPHGARALLQRAARSLAPYRGTVEGVDVPRLVEMLRAHAEAFAAWERGGPPPDLQPSIPRSEGAPR